MQKEIAMTGECELRDYQKRAMEQINDSIERNSFMVSSNIAANTARAGYRVVLWINQASEKKS